MDKNDDSLIEGIGQCHKTKKYLGLWTRPLNAQWDMVVRKLDLFNTRGEPNSANRAWNILVGEGGLTD